MMILKRETGSLEPMRQGHTGTNSKLRGHADWVRQRVDENGELTLDELVLELAGRGVRVHRSSVGRLLHRLGLSHKKSLQASEHQRLDIARERHFWITRRGPFFNRVLPRLVFIDETSTNTKLTKRTGWSRRGERLRTYAPFGAWRTQTFIAALRCHGLTAPWIIDRPMNRQIFEIYVENQLAPTLSKGDVVIMDNVAFHKSETAEDLIRASGSLGTVPAGLLARSQPNRDGLFKAQSVAAQTGGTKLRRHL